MYATWLHEPWNSSRPPPQTTGAPVAYSTKLPPTAPPNPIPRGVCAVFPSCLPAPTLAGCWRYAHAPPAGQAMMHASWCIDALECGPTRSTPCTACRAELEWRHVTAAQPHGIPCSTPGNPDTMARRFSACTSKTHPGSATWIQPLSVNAGGTCRWDTKP